MCIRDSVCSARKVIRIAGDDYPAEVVKSRFMKLDSSHVQYVMDCMKDNTTYVRNIKKYLLAALYNAPIEKKMYAHHKFNEHATVGLVADNIAQGRSAALISDAGTPGISDTHAAVVFDAKGKTFRTER